MASTRRGRLAPTPPRPGYWFAIICIIVGSMMLSIGIAGIAGAAKPTTTTTTLPFDNTCTKPVTGKLRTYITSHSNTTINLTGGCYLISSMKLPHLDHVRIVGGTYRASGKFDNALFWLQGGTGLSFSKMTFIGNNPGGYHPKLAFQAAFRNDGVAGVRYKNISVTGLYGDGLELNVLRGAQDDSGQIIGHTTDVVVNGYTINTVGRQGVAIADGNRISITNISMTNVGIDDFDLEADQGNEGVRNLTVNGCTVNSNGAFFANGGEGVGKLTHSNLIENCNMVIGKSGYAIYVIAPKGQVRGLVTFNNDTIRCGVSVYVGCLQLHGATVTVENSNVYFPGSTITPTYIKKDATTTLTLTNVTTHGKFK